MPGTASIVSDLKLKHVIQDAAYEVNGHGEGLPLRLANPKPQSIKVRNYSKVMHRGQRQ